MDYSENTMYDDVPSTGVYFGRLILLCIPVVNVIMSLIWGFAGTTDEAKHFGRAGLLVIIVITLLLFLAGFVAFLFLQARLIEINF